MCPLFQEWSEEIKAYCEQNGLNFEKARKMCKSSGKNDIALQYYDPNREKKGLLDETPMPVVLWITKQGDMLNFEQTEYTKKYLAN